jgi:hypothetical protein
VTHAIRRLALALAIIVALPSVGRADPFALEAGWLNSSLTFGGATFQDDGYDITAFSLYDQEIIAGCCASNLFFSASGGTLVSKTNNGGQTEWRYEGGGFVLKFGDDEPFFAAPIISLFISTTDALEPGADVFVTYQLAEGLFDAAFAALHGIPAHTGTGQMSEWLIVFDGDAETDVIRADDGGGNLFVNAPEVPEPALNLMLGVALTLVALRARRRRT